ncbi:hypothetical protein P8629_01575 [Hydrogenovibrio sp. 3SP14C1]|uniref:hypothetical protein n=1 Tax=Hydrogenovibrio sp. 3SP14C1 TaxID=3038774 RepID=UPI002416A650|nr:hypothetical protein [Hydrogenovibrio sp. 3SP14C1]MDG4811686.1 hypothetical protein [Hydrogenovibrio sp. 3SP14C1]
MKNVNNEFAYPAMSLKDLNCLTQNASLYVFSPTQIFEEFMGLIDSWGLPDTGMISTNSDKEWEKLMIKIVPFLSQQNDNEWVDDLSLNELNMLAYQHNRVLAGLKRLDESNPVDSSPSGVLLPLEKNARIEMLLASASIPLAWVKGIHLF